MNKDKLGIDDLKFALTSARIGLSKCVMLLNLGDETEEIQKSTDEYQKLIQNMDSMLSDRMALIKNKKRIKIIDDILNEEESES